VIRIAAANAVVGVRLALLTALAASALAGCGGAETSSTAPANAATTTDTIAIKDFAYSPTPATVRAGMTVSVTNDDRAPHTLTDRASARAFDSGTVKGGATGSVTFVKPGTYTYFCEFHPYMKGSVSVAR
jgi:plastocyanin